MIQVEMVTTKFTMSHPADGMNEVLTVQIFEPILVRVMGVGTTIKVVRRRILLSLLVTCIL